MKVGKVFKYSVIVFCFGYCCIEKILANTWLSSDEHGNSKWLVVIVIGRGNADGRLDKGIIDSGELRARFALLGVYKTYLLPSEPVIVDPKTLCYLQKSILVFLGNCFVRALSLL